VHAQKQSHPEDGDGEECGLDKGISAQIYKSHGFLPAGSWR
jgi:hypothetical protein